MSEKQQSILVKFLVAVSVILFATSVIGLIGMYTNQSVQGAQLDSNTEAMKSLEDSHTIEIRDVESLHKSGMKEIKEYHNKDVNLIRDDIKEIKADQKIIMSDVKKLLIKTGGM